MDTSFDDGRHKARADYLLKIDAAKRKMQEYMDTITSTNNKILLAFLIDATSSMQPHMKITRDVVKRLAKLLKDNFDGLQLRTTAVLYRDPLENSGKHEQLWPTDEKTFTEFMNNTKADGGGDDAEDVAGGLELLNEIIAKEDDKTQTMLVIHILDAPAHGFGAGFTRSDNHANDFERERLRTQMKNLVIRGSTFKEFEYHFFGLMDSLAFKESIKDMIDQYLPDTHSINSVFKYMNPKDDFATSLMTSTFSSVTCSVKPAFKDPFAMESKTSEAIDDFKKYGLQFTHEANDINICGSGPSDKNIGILQCIITKPVIPSSTRTFLQMLIEYCKEAPTFDIFHTNRTNWWSQFQTHMHAPKRAKLSTATEQMKNSLLFLHTAPFGKGKEHIVFHGQLASMPLEQAKEIKMLTRNNWDANTCSCVTYTPVVIKFNQAAEYAVQPKLELYAAVKFLLNHFNTMNEQHNLQFIRVDIIAPFIIEFSTVQTSFMGVNKPVFVHPKSSKTFNYALMGEVSLDKYASSYTKWINNNGVHNIHMDPELMSEPYVNYYCVLHAFILYCWRVTMGNFVPSDLQGKLVLEDQFADCGETCQSTILLTDIACSCKNKQAFDEDVNLGSHFVQKIAADALKFKDALPSRFSKFVHAMGANITDFDSIIKAK